MADEQEEGEKKKGPLLKIILLVVVILILVAAAVAATLFFTGFFDKKAAEAVAEAVEHEEGSAQAAKPAPAKSADGAGKADGKGDAKGDGKGGDAKGGKPGPKQKATPDKVRFEQTYLELERPLLANVTGSRKVIQIKLAIMTYYDDRVFNNVKKHEFALRSAVLDVMRQATEADINKPVFRTELAEKIRLTINALLEKYEDFGGIEEVHFTEFVVQ